MNGTDQAITYLQSHHGERLAVEIAYKPGLIIYERDACEQIRRNEFL